MLTRSGHPSGQGVVVTRVRGPSRGWPFLLEAALTRHTKADTELLDRAATAREARPQKGRT